jgi:3-phenylpropionate/trans-cinnamate dioxygenase ferredoxin reductase component
MNDRVVIIGGGHAAGQCVVSLRMKGWRGEITIIGEELTPPYQRPPLSKAFLAGDLAAERLLFRPEEYYAKENIDLQLGRQAVRLDRAVKKVHLDDGQVLEYSKLVLATGSRVRRINVPGADLEGVSYLRSIADVAALQDKMQPGARLAIIGAGYIGLEVAAVAAKRGLEVMVFEAADRVLERVTSPEVSRFFDQLHRSHGVEIRLGANVEGFTGKDRVTGVSLKNGEASPCDFAIVGIGIIPNTDLAEKSGLAVRDGILVDKHTRTADSHVYAIGDCTRHPSEYAGSYLRLESVHNALEQAKTAAAAICGDEIAYDQAPWFWSDQYDLKLQTVGIRDDRVDAQIIRGDPADKAFSVFYLAGDKIVAVDSINAPADHMISRRLIAANKPIDANTLADISFDLKSLL